MVSDQWIEFVNFIKESPETQEKIREITDRDEFISALLAVSQEKGLAIKRSDVLTAFRDAQESWSQRWLAR